MQKRRGEVFELAARDCLTPNPVTIDSGEFASSALHLMEQRKITAVVVVDEKRRALGVLHLHDLWTLELF
jgi:arabinose-5-phosphate isomerase